MENPTDQNNPTSMPSRQTERTPSPATASTDRIASDMKDAAAKLSQEAPSLAREAKAAASEIGDKAKQGVADAADHVRGLAEEQKTAGADRFKGYAGAIGRAAEALDDEMPLAADFVRRAAGELEHIADSVRERDIGDIAGVVQDYARRQPAIFLGVTALAGFAAVRFLMTSAQKPAGRSDILPRTPSYAGASDFRTAAVGRGQTAPTPAPVRSGSSGDFRSMPGGYVPS